MNDGSGIEQVIFAYFEAFKNADIEKILTYYADDAVFLPADLPTAEGKEAIRAAYVETLDAIRILDGGSSLAEDVQLLGDCYLVRTDSHAPVADLRSGRRDIGHFREVFLLRRVAEQWKIWRYMFNNGTQPALSLG